MVVTRFWLKLSKNIKIPAGSFAVLVRFGSVAAYEQTRAAPRKAL